MPRKDSYSLQSLKDFIAGRESGGNYSPTQSDVNPSMSGKYQFNWKLFGKDIQRVTGVKSREEFLSNKAAQEKFMDYHVNTNLLPNAQKRLKSIQKTNPGLTLEAIMAAGHHQGWGNIDKGIKSGNILNFKDGAGTSTGSYLGKNPGNVSYTGTDLSSKYISTRNFTQYPNISGNFSPIIGGTNKAASVTADYTPVGDPNVTGNQSAKGMGTKRSNASKYAGMVMPFLSNIANAFEKPLGVPKPVYNNPVAMQRISMDNDRNEVERGVRANNRWFEQNMDAQSAALNKQYTLAQRFNQLSKVNQDERNKNLEIANDEMLMNTRIQMGNNSMLNQYNQDVVERDNAVRSQRSANIANAGDKAMALYNMQQQEDLEANRMGLLMATDYNGVLKRLKKDNPDLFRTGGQIYSAGSFIRKAPLKRIN